MSEWTRERYEDIKENLEMGFFTGHHRDADAAEDALRDCLAEIDRLNAELAKSDKRLMEMQEAAIVFATKLRDAAVLLAVMPKP